MKERYVKGTGKTGRKNAPHHSTPWEKLEHWGWDVVGDCWESKLGKGTFGYARVSMPGSRATAAHRVSYEHHHGPIPEGLIVRHKCDNPPCINPDHLKVGTSAENNEDARSRGRIKIGTEVHTAKLTEAEVGFIREELASGETVKGMAHRYGVTPATIRAIRDRKTWAWLD